MLISKNTLANESKPSCGDVIKDADTAISGCQKEVQIRDLRLKESDQLILDQTEELKAKDSVIHNPWLYLVLGIVAGHFLLK